jgi:hypothetical protein
VNQQPTHQIQSLFAVAVDPRISENFRVMAEHSVARTRQTYDKVKGLAADSAVIVEDVMVAAHTGAKTIAEKALRHAEVNAETAFATACAIARARTLPEIAHLQSSFLQQQVAAAGAQTKELFELSANVTQQAFAALNAASVKTFEQLTKVA